MYQRNSTEETLLTGTPTSLIYSNQLDPELGQMHAYKDYVNHELVPILTMNPNSTASQSVPVLKSNIAHGTTPLETTPTGVTTPTSTSLLPSMSLSLLDSSPLLDNLVATTQQSPIDAGALGLKGVYTLAEEPELEAQETQIDGI